MSVQILPPSNNGNAHITTVSPMKRLTLDLPEALHRVIKKNAAEEGVPMAQKLRAILAKHYRVSEKSL